jgi:hypothetical protein
MRQRLLEAIDDLVAASAPSAIRHLNFPSNEAESRPMQMADQIIMRSVESLIPYSSQPASSPQSGRCSPRPTAFPKR